MSDWKWRSEPWASDVPYRLDESLDGFEDADGKPPTLAMAIEEAKYIIGLHNEGGTVSGEMLSGDRGPEERKTALKTIKDLKSFIKKHSRPTLAPRKSKDAS